MAPSRTSTGHSAPAGPGSRRLLRGGRPSGPALGTRGLLGGCRPAARGTPARGRPGLTGERATGGGAPALAGGALGAPAGPPGSGALLGCAQLHAGPPGLRQPDRDRLLGRARAVVALPNVVYLLSDELPGLSAGGLTLTSVFAGPLN